MTPLKPENTTKRNTTDVARPQEVTVRGGGYIKAAHAKERTGD